MDRLIPESGWPARPFKEGLTVQSVRVRRAVRLSVLWFVLLAMVLFAGPIVARGQTCAGDCDGSGEVTIDELVKAVNIALGTAMPETCLGADRSGDGTVTIDEIIVAVNYALNGCPVGSPGPSPTSTPTATPSAVESPTATPTFGVPNGIFWHPNSAYLHSVSPTSEFSFFSLLLTVDGVPESTAEVTLTGPGGTVTIPYTGQTTFDSRFFAQYQSSNLSLAYVPGATYTVTTVTSIGTASVVITAPGGITVAPDGSQVSWEYEGDNERISIFTPSFTPAFNSDDGDKTSPFSIPVSAYGAGPGTYKVSVDIRRRFTTVTGGAPGTQFVAIDQRLADVVPSALGLTHTPTTTPTNTPTRPPSPTATATPTITGTILPTPVLTGQILFKSSRPGSDRNVSHIFVMNADGSDVIQLTSGSGFDEWPQWNHDKTKIAFTRDRRLHIMNADGSGVTALRTQNFQYYPTFSPDGARIVYAEYDFTRTNLFSYELGSGQVTQLTSGDWTDASPAFSPDGDYIYFTSNRDSRFGEIYRMNADGSGVVRITTNEAYEQLGEVSPNGTKLVYAGRSAEGTSSLAIFVANVDGSDPVQLTSTADRSDDEHPIWSPDGNYIVFRPFVNGRPKIYRMQANGSFITDLSNNDSYEVAGDWK